MSDRRLLLLKRKRAILMARDNLIAFTQLMMPDPNNADDPDFSLYSAAKIPPGDRRRPRGGRGGKVSPAEIEIMPRAGKTTLASSMYPAWYIGRHPERSIIVATYNETYSWDLGRKIRDIMQTPQYRQVFPDLQIKKKSAAVNRVETTDGGVVFCVGRGSAVTGRGAHTILLDDPIKDRKEADSVVIRDNLWQWYNQVLRTRLMNKYGTIVVITTRWNEDDLVGRLTDPLNPYYSHDEAKLWRKIELPALAEENDILGRTEGEALWPERFDVEYLDELKMSDPRGFMALYQCRPSPREGAFFRHADLVPYNSMKDLPAHDTMRFYAASDHAVTLAKHGDKTCLMVVGVDTADHVWIMPDVVWLRLDSSRRRRGHAGADRKIQAAILVGREGRDREIDRAVFAQAHAGEARVLRHRSDRAGQRQGAARAVDPGAQRHADGALPDLDALVGRGAGPDPQIPQWREG